MSVIEPGGPDEELETEERGPAGPDPQRTAERVAATVFVEAAGGGLVLLTAGSQVPAALSGRPRRKAVWDEHGRCWTPEKGKTRSR